MSDLFDDGALDQVLGLTDFLEEHWALAPSPSPRAGLSWVRRRLPRVVLREAAHAVISVRYSIARFQNLSPKLFSAEREAREQLDGLDASLTYLFDDDTPSEQPEDRELSQLHAARDCDDDPLALADNLRSAVKLAGRFVDCLRVLDERFEPRALTEALDRANILEQRMREELPLRHEVDGVLLCRAVHARHLLRCLREIERAAEYVFRRGTKPLSAEAARGYRLRDEHTEPRASAEVG